MVWLMETLRTYLEEQLLIRSYVKKSFNIAKIRKFDGYQGGLASMVYKFGTLVQQGSIYLVHSCELFQFEFLQ